MCLKRIIASALALFLIAQAADAAGPAAPEAAKPKPLMKDFMGLSVHSVGFKPDLYRPVCELVRDYHNLNWDVGKDPSTPTRFPMGAVAEGDWLNWGPMYGSWAQAGIRTDVCVQWGADLSPDKWHDIPKDAYAYGKSFADYFGSKGEKMVQAVEIGNEFGSSYDDKAYHEIFNNMARGIRDGDPAMKIVTCNVSIDGDEHAKPLAPFKDAKDLFDVVRIHQYALKSAAPTWQRSYPEDPDLKYLATISDIIGYRNQNLPGKEIWLTDFSYDSCTRPAPKTGEFAQWTGVDDDAQARYIVRSFLVFSAMDLDRAYLYFFNDNDEPAMYGSSGITRKFAPKPSYYAMRHLYQTLGEYRFANAVRQDKGQLYVYEYVRGGDPKDRIFVAWSPTDTRQPAEQSIDLPARPASARRMPLTDGAAPAVPVHAFQDGKLKVQIDGSPVYIQVRLP